MVSKKKKPWEIKRKGKSNLFCLKAVASIIFSVEMNSRRSRFQGTYSPGVLP